MDFYNQPTPQTFAEKLSLIIKQNEKTILNAYIIIMGALGIVGTAKIVDKFKEKNRSTTVDEPLNEQYEAVNEPLVTVEDMDNEASEEERIRQVMSLLGKRSGAAKQKKKDLSQYNKQVQNGK